MLIECHCIAVFRICIVFSIMLFDFKNRVSEVWSNSFLEKLAIRPESQHKACSVCIRHKAIMRSLQGDQLSWRAQMRQYTLHLERQYRDRTCYWDSRVQSRLKTTLSSGIQTISAIVDGLDHSKMKWPRCYACSSKEWSQFQRPNLDLTACIIHGHAVMLTATWPWVEKAASLNIDICAHALDYVAATGADTRNCQFLLQCDNTSREAKNNPTLRWMGFMVGSSKLKRSELRCLSSGHSHEDVDQYFSCISNHIQSKKEIASPQRFVETLEEFMQNKQIRPHEPHREVNLVSSVRDWTFGRRCRLELV